MPQIKDISKKFFIYNNITLCYNYIREKERGSINELLKRIAASVIVFENYEESTQTDLYFGL